MCSRQKFFLYLIGIFSVYLGFFLDENSSGGGKIDHDYILPFIIKFSEDFSVGINLFFNDNGILIHSPLFYILISSIIKVSNSLFFAKIFYIIICCVLPFIFYQILKIKNFRENSLIFFLSLIIFLSPYFRSSAIWLLGDNLSLIFFSLSILFYLKTERITKLINYFLCSFFLILCCYLRYYYFLFIIFYLYRFFFKLSLRQFFLLILFCFILSLPALGYFNYIIINYDFLSLISIKTSINIHINFLIISTIVFFYIFPFVLIQFRELLNFVRTSKIFILIISLFLILFYFYDGITNSQLIEYDIGGGIFIKLAKLINLNIKIFIYIVSFCSLTCLLFLFQKNLILNFSIFIILLLSLPMAVIYQKYFDPLLFFIFFGLIKSEILDQIFHKNLTNIFVVYIYFTSFFIISTIYYL
jgi:hypothetical protein